MAAKKTAKSPAKATPADESPKAAKKAASKKVAKKAVKKAATTAAPKTRKPSATTSDQIALNAYLIYRRRIELGLPGDARSDWFEAERQLTLGS